MNHCLCIFSCLVWLVSGHSAIAAASILIEPFPIHSRTDPLVVESPVTFRWHEDRTLYVRVRVHDVLLYPRHTQNRGLESGVTFRLDPGTYEIEFEEQDPSYRAGVQEPITTFIQVPARPQWIDLRAGGPAVNEHMREVRRLLEQMKNHDASLSVKVGEISSGMDSVSGKLDDLTTRVSDMNDDLAALHEQFIVTDDGEEAEKPTRVHRPLQVLFDRVKALGKSVN